MRRSRYCSNVCADETEKIHQKEDKKRLNFTYRKIKLLFPPIYKVSIKCLVMTVFEIKALLWVRIPVLLLLLPFVSWTNWCTPVASLIGVLFEARLLRKPFVSSHFLCTFSGEFPTETPLWIFWCFLSCFKTYLQFSKVLNKSDNTLKLFWVWTCLFHYQMVKSISEPVTVSLYQSGLVLMQEYFLIAFFHFLFCTKTFHLDGFVLVTCNARISDQLLMHYFFHLFSMMCPR